MNITPEQKNILCKSCDPYVRNGGCWRRSVSNLWKKLCPCMECLIKPICKKDCKLFREWDESILEKRRNPSS